MLFIRERMQSGRRPGAQHLCFPRTTHTCSLSLSNESVSAAFSGTVALHVVEIMLNSLASGDESFLRAQFQVGPDPP